MPEELTPEQEQRIATWESVQAGQIYLSKQEVFAQDMIDEAFVGTDGVDLRSSLAIDNVLTAAVLINWLDTDTVLRGLIGGTADYTALFSKIAGVTAPDIEFVQAAQLRVKAETPPQTISASQQAELAQEPAPSTIMQTPANLHLSTTGQIALRISWIVQNARGMTAANQNFKQQAWRVAHEKDPNLTAGAWAALMGFTTAGISGIKGFVRANQVGIGGNFFKDLGRSISRLFKNPLATFRRWAIEIGRGMQQVGKLGQWLSDKVPFIGAATGWMPVLFGELGHALAEQNINAFNEQLVTVTSGKALQQIGFILTLVGTILQVTPLAPLGTILIAVGALCVVAGNAITQLYVMTRNKRLSLEAYQARLAELKRLKQAQQDALNATGQTMPETQAAPVASGAGFGVAAVVGVVALFFLR